MAAMAEDPYSPQNIDLHWANFMREFMDDLEEFSKIEYRLYRGAKRYSHAAQVMKSNGVKLLLRMYYAPDADIESANGGTYNANSFGLAWTNLVRQSNFQMMLENHRWQQESVWNIGRQLTQPRDTDWARFVAIISPQMQQIKRVMRGDYTGEEAETKLKQALRSEEIRTLLKMDQMPSVGFPSGTPPESFSAQQFGEQWDRMTQEPLFKYLFWEDDDLEDSDSETESEEDSDEEMSESSSSSSGAPTSSAGFAVGDIFIKKHAEGQAAKWIIILTTPDEGFGRSYLLLSANRIFEGIGEETLVRDFRYEMMASRYSYPLEMFEVPDYEAVEHGFLSWNDLRDYIESTTEKTRQQKSNTYNFYLSIRPEPSAAFPASPAKRKATDKTSTRKKRRREPTNRNTTNKDNSDLARAVSQLLAEPPGTLTIDITTPAEAMLLREAPMTRQGPRWPDLILGDIVERRDQPGLYMLIGGGTLQPFGAAAESERYYDFVSKLGDTMRLGEADVNNYIAIYTYYRDQIPTKFQETIEKFKLHKLGLEQLIQEQHSFYNDSFNTAFYQVGEALMLQNVFQEGSEATDAAADAEVARVEQLLATVKKAAKKAAMEKRNVEDKQWFDRTWKQDLLDDQQRRGRAYMLRKNKEYYTPAEAAAIDAEVMREVSTTGDRCMICFDAVKRRRDPDDDDPEDHGKPVKLNCGHVFHGNCLRAWQTPKMHNNNTYNNPRDTRAHLVINDNLKCPVCKAATLDPSMRDSIYRFVNLRF